MAATVIEKTLNDDMFESVFTEVGAGVNFALPNTSTMRTYRLNAENCVFVYDGLNDFLLDHIGNYIYSRAQIDSFETTGKTHSIARRAIDLLKKVYNFDEDSIGDELGDILLYFLLEGKLLAPKLFSKIELTQNGGSIANSYGVHLLPLDNSRFQMVYGKSRIDDGIRGAIDNAFEYIEMIRSGGMSSYQIVDSGILEKAYDQKTTEFLKKILKPQKNGVFSADTKAFGIVLGYSLGLKTEEMTHDEFLDVMAKKMEKDILAHTDYIINKIKVAKLTTHSFYVYALPFNDANDKNSIMRKLIGR